MAVKTSSKTIVSLEDPASLQTLLSSPTFSRTASPPSLMSASGTELSPATPISGAPFLGTSGVFTTSTADQVVVPVSDTSVTSEGTTQNITFNTDSNRSVVIAGITTTETSTAIVDSVSVYNTDGDIFVTGVDQRSVQQFIYGSGSDYTLPTASTVVLGGVKIDGSTILIDSDGVISAAPGGYVLPTASTSVLGGVKVDGTTIVIDGSGVISATASGSGTVTSVNVAGGTTGLTTSGGPITSSGTITLGGILSVAHGGTGANSTSGAFDALAPTTTTGDLIYFDGTDNVRLGIGSAGQVLTVSGGIPAWANTGATGTVTSVSFSSGNGFTGTVTNSTTTPSISVGTSVTGLLKGDGLAVTAAVANTDYQLPITVTTTGNSGPATFVGNVLNIPDYSTGGGGGSGVSQIVAGSNISVSNGGLGVVTIDNAYTLPTAGEGSGGTLGGVRVDGSTIVIDGNGIITAVGGGGGGSGTVTSVGVSGGTTGLTVSGSPITTSGTMTLGGVLAVAHGGTGSNTAQGSFAALAPSQTGNAGRLLTTDGTTASWTSLGITNELYVSKGGNDATADGTITNPFLTIQAAVNYLNSNYPVASNSGTPFVIIVAPGTYNENVTINRFLTHLWGYEGQLKTTRINGTVTVNGAVNYSGLFQNSVSITNFFIGNSSNNALVVSGIQPTSIDITECSLYTSDTGIPFVMDNTAVGGNRLRLMNADLIAEGNASALDVTNVTNGTINAVNTNSSRSGGSAWKFTNTVCTLGTIQLVGVGASGPSNLLELVGSSTVLSIGYSSFTSSTTNGNGISIGAGATATVGDCFYNIPLGTGYAVTGSAGGIYVRGGNQAVPGTNNTVNPVLTATTFTMSTHVAASDLIGTVAIANGGTGASTKTAAFNALAPTTTNGDLIYFNGTNNVRLGIGSAGQVLTVSSGIPAWSSAGTGTVTSLSVVSTNGFSGTVANATTTPAITLGTTVTGLLKGNGSAISAAVANTDYQMPITLTTTGSSGAATLVNNVLNIPQYSGGGGTPGGSNTELQFNNAGSFGGISSVTWNGTALSLGSNTQVKITGGTSGQVLSTDGSGNLSWATASGGATGLIEQVVFRYSAGGSGTFAVADPIYSNTAGVTAVVTDAATCVVSFTFTGKSNPPKSIITYGQVFSTNTFIIRSPIGPSSTTPTVAGGGTNTAPDIALGTFTSTNTMSLQLRPSDTGATGAVGQRAWLVVVFGF